MFCGETTAAMWVHSSRSRGGKRRHRLFFNLVFLQPICFLPAFVRALEKAPKPSTCSTAVVLTRPMDWRLHGGERKKTADCLDSRRPSVESRKEQKGGDTWLCLVAAGIRIKLNQTNTQTNIVATLWFRDAATQGASVVFITRRASCYFILRPTKKLIVIVPPACCRPRVLSSGLVCVAKRGKKETQDNWGDEAGVLSIFLSLDLEIFFFYTSTEQRCRAEGQGQQGVKSPRLNRSIQKIQNTTFVK